MRNYAIYACAVTIRIVVCFAILAFAYQLDFPPFMILIIALLNDGTIMTLSVDRVLPSNTPDAWDLGEIYAYAVAYGLYLTVSTIALVLVIMHTNFFEDKFGVSLSEESAEAGRKLANDPQLHMIVYLQVAIISQALIFVTRSHGFFFMERPSFALMGAFVVAQVISSIIAAYGNWGFTHIRAISGAWIGIVWVWVSFLLLLWGVYRADHALQNIIWFFPLDLIKFAMKATVIKYIRERREKKAADELRKSQGGEIPLVRTQSRAASIHESLYSNRVSFLQRAAKKVGFGGKVRIAREFPCFV
jgi:H+-transporting ATPase